MTNLDLFDAAEPAARRQESLGPGAFVLRAFAISRAKALLEAVDYIIRRAPFRPAVRPKG